jgi:hypothetical protein
VKATLLIATLAALTTVSASGEPPVVVEASAIDSSVDPASVTYTARDRNIYGQQKQFETDAGLIAVARRLAIDNAKYKQVMMPVQIYSSDGSDRELAEYTHHGSAHDLRITGPDRLVRKIVKLPKAESPNSSMKKQTAQGAAPSGAAIDPSVVTYKIVEGPGTRFGHIIIPPKLATEAGLSLSQNRSIKTRRSFLLSDSRFMTMRRRSVS